MRLVIVKIENADDLELAKEEITHLNSIIVGLENGGYKKDASIIRVYRDLIYSEKIKYEEKLEESKKEKVLFHMHIEVPLTFLNFINIEALELDTKMYKFSKNYKSGSFISAKTYSRDEIIRSSDGVFSWNGHEIVAVSMLYPVTIGTFNRFEKSKYNDSVHDYTHNNIDVNLRNYLQEVHFS